MKSKPLHALLTALFFFAIVSGQIYLQAQASNAGDDRPGFFSGTIKVLYLLHNQFGANTHFYIDNIRDYGWEPATAALTTSVQPCSWSAQYGNLPFEVDTLITDISDPTYWDVIAIMPAKWWSGNAYGDFLNSPETLDLIKQASDAGKVIWATCAGVRVLAAADVIQGKNVTGKENFQNEYLAAGANYLGPDILPVIDGNIVTSTKGMYFNIENIEAISTAIEGLVNRGKSQFNPNEGIFASGWEDSNQTDLIWDKTFGGTESDGISAICLLNDGRLFAGGFTHSQSMATNIGLYLDTDGNFQQMISGGGASNEYINDVCPGSGGTVFTAGYTASFGNGKKDMFIQRINADGSLAWPYSYGGEEIDVAESICLTPENDLLICGYTQSFGAGENDVYLVKLSDNGSFIWQKTFGGEKSDMGHRVIILSNGDYLLFGETGSFGGGKKDFYLIRTDSDGNEIWHKTYGNQDYQAGFDVIETADGSLVMVGSSDIHGEDFLNVYMIKTDQEGNLIWEKMFGCPAGFYEYGKLLMETGDGNYLVCATVNDPVTRTNDAFLFITDPQGEILWSETLGQEGSERIRSLCPGTDGAVFLAGQTNSRGEGLYDCWVMRFQNPLVSADPHSTSGNDSDFGCSPNPFMQSTTLRFSSNKSTILTVYDSGGRQVRDLGMFPAGEHNTDWDGRSEDGTMLGPGAYLIRLKAEDCTVKTLKLVKAK